MLNIDSNCVFVSNKITPNNAFDSMFQQQTLQERHNL